MVATPKALIILLALLLVCDANIFFVSMLFDLIKLIAVTAETEIKMSIKLVDWSAIRKGHIYLNKPAPERCRFI